MRLLPVTRKGISSEKSFHLNVIYIRNATFSVWLMYHTFASMDVIKWCGYLIRKLVSFQKGPNTDIFHWVNFIHAKSFDRQNDLNSLNVSLAINLNRRKFCKLSPHIFFFLSEFPFSVARKKKLFPFYTQYESSVAQNCQTVLKCRQRSHFSRNHFQRAIKIIHSKRAVEILVRCTHFENMSSLSLSSFWLARIRIQFCWYGL